MIYYKVSFNDVKTKLPNLTKEQYNEKYQRLKRLVNPPDPKIVFDDANKTIEISYYMPDLFAYNEPFKMELQDAFDDGTVDDVVVRFERVLGTPELPAWKAEYLDQARESLRQVDYKDVPDDTPKPDPGTNDLENLTNIINRNPGICLGGDHNDHPRDDLLNALLDQPGHGGIGIFFIEELNVIDQPLVEQFLNSAPGTDMPEPLVTRLTYAAGGLKTLLEKM